MPTILNAKKHRADREAKRADYSAIASYYDKARPAPSDFWISKLVSLGKMEPGSGVLDIGCGTGRYTIKIAGSPGARVFALDNSATMLHRALGSDRGRKIGWVLADANRLPFKQNSFDCVYMTMVLHHIESIDRALKGILRTLEHGGRLVILTSSHSAIRRHPLRNFPGVIAIDLKRFPSIPSLKSAMRHAGFRNVRSFVVTHDEGEIPVDRYCEMVRGKYISTLSLLDERKFETGYKIFRDRITKAHGKRMRRVLSFNFVVGEKA